MTFWLKTGNTSLKEQEAKQVSVLIKLSQDVKSSQQPKGGAGTGLSHLVIVCVSTHTQDNRAKMRKEQVGAGTGRTPQKYRQSEMEAFLPKMA